MDRIIFLPHIFFFFHNLLHSDIYKNMEEDRSQLLLHCYFKCDLSVQIKAAWRGYCDFGFILINWAALVQIMFESTIIIKSIDERNLHHGDGDITCFFDDHGFVCRFQFGCWVATKGEISSWCRIRAAWQTLQFLHVLLLDGLLLRDRNSLDFNLQHRSEAIRCASFITHHLIQKDANLHVWHMHNISILVFGLHHNSSGPATADVVFVQNEWGLLRVCVGVWLKPPESRMVKMLGWGL